MRKERSKDAVEGGGVLNTSVRRRQDAFSGKRKDSPTKLGTIKGWSEI